MFRTVFAAMLIAFAGLGAGATTAEAADLCLAFKLKCDGFEPSWQFETGVDAGQKVVRFIDPENTNFETEPLVYESCLVEGSPNDFELTSAPPLNLVANIVGQSCTLPNDEETGFAATVTFVQGALTDHPTEVQGTGCCRMLE